MPSFLVVGGSRGLGLGFVEELVSACCWQRSVVTNGLGQLKETDNFVVTTARDLARSPGLLHLTETYSKDRLAVLLLDLAQKDTITKAGTDAAALLPHGLDFLIHNSAINLRPVGRFEDMYVAMSDHPASGIMTFIFSDLDQLEEELRINAVAPIHVVRTFLPLIRQSAAPERKILIISSGLASVENAYFWAGLSEGYSVSKAALNMYVFKSIALLAIVLMECRVVHKWGTALKHEGINMIAIQPGMHVLVVIAFRIVDVRLYRLCRHRHGARSQRVD